MRCGPNVIIIQHGSRYRFALQIYLLRQLCIPQAQVKLRETITPDVGPTIKSIIFILLVITLPVRAFADCGWNWGKTFYGCGTIGIFNSVGRTLPVISDGVRFNPGAIPSLPTPVGIEGTLSSKTEGDSKLQVSIMKGFTYVGVGLSSWTENTFSTPNVQRTINTQYAPLLGSYEKSNNMGFRGGVSVNVPLGALLESFTKVSVGASYGQGRVVGSNSRTLGLTADSGFISMGYSQTNETILEVLPTARTRTLSFGLTGYGFYAGYSLMKFTLGNYSQPTIRYLSARWATATYAVYAAIKRDIDHRFQQRTFKTANFQYNVTKRLILGYVYGLYPDSHSLSFQLYF